MRCKLVKISTTTATIFHQIKGETSILGTTNISGHTSRLRSTHTFTDPKIPSLLEVFVCGRPRLRPVCICRTFRARISCSVSICLRSGLCTPSTSYSAILFWSIPIISLSLSLYRGYNFRGQVADIDNRIH